MVDSIRPLITLIRTLSRKKLERPDGVCEPTGVGGGISGDSRAAAPDRSSQLEGRLRARLAAVAIADPDQARHIFVETVLLAEIGDELARDPAFADVVAKVSAQLHADATVRAQLTTLIASLRA
jgi:hypothetical protein